MRAEMFAGIYDLLADRIYRLAVIVTADTVTASRVAQQVFEDLWVAIDRADLAPHPAAGLADFTDRRVLHHARPSRSAAGTRLKDLSALTDLERRCIALAHRGDRSTDQIARLLGVERRTVHEAIRDGLLTLSPTLAAGRS